MLDPSLRTPAPVTKAFDAYTGAVTAVVVKGHVCATLGTNVSHAASSASLHGAGLLDPRTGRFNANLAQRRVADSVVKVFDLRTSRQLPPQPFMGGTGGGGLGSPSFLAFLPSFSASLFAASPGGALRLIEARGTDATQYFQVAT